MSSERDAQQPSERVLKQLFAQAKPRPDPPEADAAEIRRAVYAEWDAVTGRRLWRRRVAVGMAASVFVVFAIWIGRGIGPSVPPAPVARVERIQGIVEGDSGVRLAVDSALVAGDRLTTQAGQVALRLASGGSLRVGPRSAVVLTGADAAELVNGVLYFDSERGRTGTEFNVTTELGTIRDVGTQFVVRLDADRTALDVGVRQGRIVLATERASGTAESGERLIAARDAPAIRREPMATFGGDWEWTETVAPPFDVDGRTVSEFLAWFAQQTGRTVVFASSAAERLARETRLSGSIDLEPLQELSAVLALTDLIYTLEGERVVINTR